MSKKRSKAKRRAASKPGRRAQPSRPTAQEYHGRWTALDGIVLSDTPGVTWDTFNATLQAAIDADAAFYCDAVQTLSRSLMDAPQRAFVNEHVREAFELGFRMALSRYREHLEHVPELQRRRDNAAARSQAGNASKRKAPVAVGGSTMPREERDAAMAAEYVALLKRMKPTPACQLLADKYGFESWQGVDSAIKRFHKRAGQ